MDRRRHDRRTLARPYRVGTAGKTSSEHQGSSSERYESPSNRYESSSERHESGTSMTYRPSSCSEMMYSSRL